MPQPSASESLEVMSHATEIKAEAGNIVTTHNMSKAKRVKKEEDEDGKDHTAPLGSMSNKTGYSIAMALGKPGFNPTDPKYEGMKPSELRKDFWKNAGRNWREAVERERAHAREMGVQGLGGRGTPIDLRTDVGLTEALRSTGHAVGWTPEEVNQMRVDNLTLINSTTRTGVGRYVTPDAADQRMLSLAYTCFGRMTRLI